MSARAPGTEGPGRLDDPTGAASGCPDWYETGLDATGVAVLRRFHEAWTRGDLPAVLALVDENVVIHPLHGAMFTRMEFRGHDGITDWYHEMTDPWERFEAIVEEAAATREGAIGLLRVVGYRGDDGFHARVGVVIETRDGRISSLTARNASEVEKRLRGGSPQPGCLAR